MNNFTNTANAKPLRNIREVVQNSDARNVLLYNKLQKLLDVPLEAGNKLLEHRNSLVSTKRKHAFHKRNFLEQMQLFLSSFLNSTKSCAMHADMGEPSYARDSLIQALNLGKFFRNTFGKEKQDSIFQQFYEVLKFRFDEYNVMDTVLEYVRLCGDLVFKNALDDKNNEKEAINLAWQAEEVKTWRLLYVIYYDKFFLQENNKSDSEIISSELSEKEVVNQLYFHNATIRKYKLIVDWLEDCYDLFGNKLEVDYYEEALADWENTSLVFDCNTAIASKVQDKLKHLQSIFHLVRQGRIQEAIDICIYCGQKGLAAILEDWYLNNVYHDYNNQKYKKHPQRDLWKLCAWKIVSSNKCNQYTRATIGAFCGHLTSLEVLLSEAWEDLLWANIKTQFDILVESEVRSICRKEYLPMPDDYWNNKMNLQQIFNELSIHPNSAIRDYACSKMGIIQTHLILNNTSGLLKDINDWIKESKKTAPLTSHMLRFLTHIVLFLREIGCVDKEQYAINVIEAYVEVLIDMKKSAPITFYIAFLPAKYQWVLYSKYLNHIIDSGERTVAVNSAAIARIDVENITKYTTIKQLSRSPTDAEKNQYTPEGIISDYDHSKVRALEWLTFLPSQRGELLWQTNALIRHFLTENKTECVRAAIFMVPTYTIPKLCEFYGSKYKMPPRERCSVKEYNSYRAYLESVDSFKYWSKLLTEEPKKPEKFDDEFDYKNYEVKHSDWKVVFDTQTAVTRDALHNVMCFSINGWLVDPYMIEYPPYIYEADWTNRLLQMKKLRSIYIPETVNLLFEVMYNVKNYVGCLHLADEVISEERQLYKEFSKRKLSKLLQNTTKASNMLLGA